MNRSCERTTTHRCYHPSFTPGRGFRSLGIPKLELSDSADGKKNRLRCLRYGTWSFTTASSACRDFLWRHAIYLKLEIRRFCPKCGKVSRRSFPPATIPLHQRFAFYVAALQYLHGQGCRPGTAPGPQDGHALENSTCGKTSPCRNPAQTIGLDEIHPEGPHLPDRRQRSGEEAAHWFGGTDRSEQSLKPLSRARAAKINGYGLCHGHVETLRKRDT